MTTISLGGMARIQVGYQSRVSVDEDLAGTHRLIRPQDIDDRGELHGAGAMRFTPNKDASRYQLRTGDILFPARGTDHVPTLVNVQLESAVASNSFYIIRVKDAAALLPGYLAWWLAQTPAQRFFRRNEGLSTIAFLSKSDLMDCPVDVPPLGTQQLITAAADLQRREQDLQWKLAAAKGKLVRGLGMQAVRNGTED